MWHWQGRRFTIKHCKNKALAFFPTKKSNTLTALAKTGKPTSLANPDQYKAVQLKMNEHRNI